MFVFLSGTLVLDVGSYVCYLRFLSFFSSSATEDDAEGQEAGQECQDDVGDDQGGNPGS